MGTNYYAHIDPCPLCGESKKKLHIGKHSFGWKFSFRGYRDPLDGPYIVSWKDWTVILGSKQVEIRDEYGKVVSLDGLEKIIENAKKNNRCGARESMEGKYGEERARDCWIDPEGNGFCGTEFS